MTDIKTLAGPLDKEGLAWIASLYGRSDAKYGRMSFLRHLFVENPYGWSLHAFAEDHGSVVGHCAVVPVRARVGDGEALSGKVEAFYVDEAHRGARESVSGRSLALRLLDAVTDIADERGVDPLHAYVSPRVGAIFERAGYRCNVVGDRAYTIVRPELALSEDARMRKALVRLTATGQQGISILAGAVTGASHEKVVVEPPTAADAQLVDLTTDSASWTVSGADSWPWFVDSGFIRALVRPGPDGWRALVCSEDAGKPVHLLGWKPERPGLVPAVGLLAGLAGFARTRSAPSVRVQQWHGEGSALARACRLMGLIPREPFTLYVRASQAPIAVVPSPFFYATF